MDFKILFFTASFSFVLWFQLLVALLLYFLRLCVQLLAFCLKSKLRKLLSSNHYLDHNGKLLVAHNLLISIRISGLVDVEAFRQTFLRECVNKKNPTTGSLLFPELQEEIKVWCGYPFWCKSSKKFDINSFIVDGKEANGKKVSAGLDEEALQDIELNILKREFLREDGSPWKIYLIHDIGAEGRTPTTRLLLSFHHSLGDGHSMYGLLMRLAADGDSTKWTSSIANTTKPSCGESLMRLLPPRNPLLFPLRLMRNFIKCSTPPPFYVNAKEMTRNTRDVVKSKTIPKSILTQIAKKNGVPFTAVLLNAVTGALREYTKGSDSKIPDFIMCPMPIPMSSREPGTTLANKIQSVEFTLPLGKADASARLQDCKQTIDEARSSAFPILVRLGLFIDNGYPLSWKPSANAMPPIILSSFPGPKESVSIIENNHKVLDMDFSWNGSGYVSVVVTTLTYGDGIRIVLSADPLAFQHGTGGVSKIIELIEKEISQMV